MLKTIRYTTDKTRKDRKQVKMRYNNKNMLVVAKVRYKKPKGNIMNKNNRQNHNLTLKKKRKKMTKTKRNATDETRDDRKQVKIRKIPKIYW